MVDTGVVGSSLAKTDTCHARMLLATFDVSLSVSGNTCSANGPAIEQDDAKYSDTSTHSELTCACRCRSEDQEAEMNSNTVTRKRHCCWYIETSDATATARKICNIDVM